VTAEDAGSRSLAVRDPRYSGATCKFETPFLFVDDSWLT
jgi:hypothetical protein